MDPQGGDLGRTRGFLTQKKIGVRFLTMGDVKAVRIPMVGKSFSYQIECQMSPGWPWLKNVMSEFPVWSPGGWSESPGMSQVPPWGSTLTGALWTCTEDDTSF